MDPVEQDLEHFVMSAEVEKYKTKHYFTIAYKLLCALNFIHTAGVMHRDIQPKNIMVDRFLNVKIANFGKARTIIEHH